ncbi:MAG: hypothetical protein AB7O73_11920 [Bacteroidia bacterium]
MEGKQLHNLKLASLSTLIFLINTILSGQDSIYNKEVANIISIVNQVEEAQNFIDQIDPDEVTKLPYGLRKQIGTTRYVIAIDSIKYKSNGAYFSAFAALDFPGTTKKLAFRASNIKFNPAGVIGGEQARLYLASEHLIKINKVVSLYLPKNVQNYIVWNCNGFEAINLSGTFIFSSDYLIPDSSNTADKTVSASFQIYTKDLHQFITSISMSPFQLKDLKDWKFEVKNATVDLSENMDAMDMSFPPGYQNPNLVAPGMWTGFFLKEFNVTLPKELTGKTQTKISCKNLLIEHLGLSGSIETILNNEAIKNDLNGWDFSISKVGLGFVCNNLNSGFLNGNVQIPLLDTTSKLNYHASIFYNPELKESDYNFTLKTLSNIRCNIFSAGLNLYPNSSISIQKVNGALKPRAILSGQIFFLNAKFNSNNAKIGFQDLTFISDAPYLTNGLFSFNDPNGKKLSSYSYPIVVNDISLGIIQNQPVAGFSVSLNLNDETVNPLSVGTKVILKGKFNRRDYFNSDLNKNVPKITGAFDKVEIQAIQLNASSLTYTMAGTILYTDEHPKYGNGFFGQINVHLPKLSNPIQASVGFGKKEDYRYFFADARLQTSIKLGTHIRLTSIIGGLYYHMSPDLISEDQFINLNSNFSSVNSSALNYTPTKTISLGFKAGAGYEYAINPYPLNGDVLFEMNFTSSGGIGKIALSGDVYGLSSVQLRNNAPIKGKIGLIFDAPNSTFDALARIQFKAGTAIQGDGFLKFHAEKDVWYLHIGKPTNPNTIKLMNLVSLPSYIMIGKVIDPPFELPAAMKGNPVFTQHYGKRDLLQLGESRGFCAGAKITSHLDRRFGFSFFNVQGYFNFDLGFDMMLSNYGEKAYCENSDKKIGFNGWQANGNMYLAMNGGVNINGHLKFPFGCPKTYQICIGGVCTDIKVDCIIDKDFSYNVFDAGVNALVTAKAPSPLFFAGALDCHYSILGKVSGNFNYDFSFGNQCKEVLK